MRRASRLTPPPPPCRAGRSPSPFHGGGELPCQLHHVAAKVLTERINALATMLFVSSAAGIHRVRRVLIEEDVGQHHRPNFQAVIEHACLGEKLQHMTSRSRRSSLLRRSAALRVRARAASTQIDVERLGEARIGDRGREPMCAASSSAALRHSPSRVPKEKIATLLPSRTMRPLPISSGLPSSGSATPRALAARIAQRRGPIVDRDRGRDHVHEFGFVGRRHHARNSAGSRDRRHRTRRHGSGRRRRRDRRGPSRNAPAGSGSRRRARPDRRRVAGRSSRWRRTA